MRAGSHASPLRNHLDMIGLSPDRPLHRIQKPLNLSTSDLEMNQAHHDDLDDLLAKYSQPELQTDTFEDVHDGDDPGTCVISLMNELLEEALTHKATHIHLYPTKEEFRAAYRIDGLLSQAGSFPDRLKNAIAGRLKVMSQMDLAERRRPQSGRITLVRDAGRASFFVETTPTLHGERITMRILPSVTGPMRLVELGLSEPVYQSLLETLALRQGLFLVAGPTGSGKTTTLYAMLAQLDPHVRSILTIECPPERTLVGIRQMEAVPAMGIDVPLLLRSAARHDPEVSRSGVGGNDASTGEHRLSCVGWHPYK